MPRVFPRQEQWIRATRFQRLGLADLLHPDELTPASIETWIRQIEIGENKTTSGIEMNGLSRVVDYAHRLVASEIVL